MISTFILLFALIIVGAYSLNLSRKQTSPQLPLQPTVSPTKISTPTPSPSLIPTTIHFISPTPDETAGWKSYTNTMVGYSLRYPEKWVLNDCQTIVFFDEYKLPSCGTDSLGFFSINAQHSAVPISFDDYSENIYQIEQETIKLNNQVGLQAVIRKIKPAPGPDIFTETRLKHGSTLLTITLWNSQYQAEYNQILSTFKFLDGEDTKTVRLYYYNSSLDPKSDCLTSAIVPVERKIPPSETLIQDTIELLIEGGSTQSEREAGFSTEFPHQGFKLLGASLENGVLTLEFPEIYGFTTGGACRVGLLRTEIEKTALQFPDVSEVRFDPEVFQP